MSELLSPANVWVWGGLLVLLTFMVFRFVRDRCVAPEDVTLAALWNEIEQAVVVRDVAPQSESEIWFHAGRVDGRYQSIMSRHHIERIELCHQQYSGHIIIEAENGKVLGWQRCNDSFCPYRFDREGQTAFFIFRALKRQL